MTVEQDTCITCGDVAVELTVVSVDGGDAVCRADDGGTELVAIELVAPVEQGDRLLVHAKVALERLSPAVARQAVSLGEPSLQGDGR